MMLSIPERRRSPRVAVGSDAWFALPSTWRVDLLDVSLSGMAFTSMYRLEVGRIASVRTTLGRDAFHGDVQICWSRPRSGKGGAAPPTPHFEVGAVFLPLQDSSLRVLESFLKHSRLQ